MKKPDKPYKEFPLFAHQCGQWVKKIRGKLWYFGVWAEPIEALERYKKEVDDIQSGRDPRRMVASADDANCQLVDLVNTFLSSKKNLVDTGRLSNKMFSQYRDACKVLIDHFGRTVRVGSLGPKDFTSLLQSFPRTWGLSMITGYVSRIRSVFLFGSETDLIAVPVKFGPDFIRPRKSEQRRERAGKLAERGRLAFEFRECRELLAATNNVQLQACIMLGLNAGFGNTDCSTLTKSSVNLETGWIDFPRPKTGIERRVPLWPETVSALTAALDKRPASAEPELQDRFFLTREGMPLVWDRMSDDGKYMSVNNLTLTFGRLLRRAAIHKSGHNFYSLRRTFETVASSTKDQVAIDMIMGHDDSSMAAVYRQGIEESRLRDVVRHVREWLYPERIRELA
jgi:integrase